MARRRPFTGKPITKPPVIPPAPQPPVNTIPGDTTTFINTALLFSSSVGNQIRVADSDSAVLTCTISTDKGYIEVLPITGVAVTNNKTAKVVVVGSPTNINRALNGMYFVPFLDVSGLATVTVRTTDGTNIDTDSFTVNITGVAPPPPAPGPAPQNSIPGPQTVVSGANLALSGANAFSVADSDSVALTSVLTVSNGRVSVPTGGGANVLGNNSSTVSINGTPAQINSALAGMVFVSNQGFVGTASIKIATTDGSSTDTDTVNISVTSASGPAPSPAPASPPFYPFGSRLDLTNSRYPFGVMVSNRSGSSMDTDLRTKYNQWKAARVYNVPAISGAKAVKFTDDPYPNTTKALTVSEGMGYGMLLSAVFHDQATFDGLLKLVRARPAYGTSGTSRPDLYLMDWKLGPNGESSANYGGGFPATDGDLDIAQALLMADRQWGNTNTTWNYKLEAQRTIAAIKEWYFNPSDLPFGSAGSDVVRTSDFMFGHLRSFANAVSDEWWEDTVIPRMLTVNEKCQTVFSAANGGPACFVPDAVVNTDGTLAGKPIGSLRNGSLPGNVTNFAQAFGLTGQTVYGSGFDNYTPSPGGRLDFVGTEMHYFANAQRCPWRWGSDFIFSGEAGLKTQCNRLVNYVKTAWPNPSSTPIGMRLNTGLQGPQAGPISMGNAWTARGLVAGFMVGAMVDSAHQAYINACYDYCMTNWITAYYDCELLLLAMVVASGNWWSYPGVNVAGASQAPVNSVPGAQALPTGSSKTFSTSNNNALGVTDPNSSNLTVTLTAVHGTLKAIGGGGGVLADGFPAKVLAGYWPFWDTQPLLSVSQNYNVVYLFAARNAGTNLGDGSVAWDTPGIPSSADIQTMRARGQKVILSVGGAGRGYVYDNRTKSTNLVNSLISIINSFGGVDGVDYNFYEGGILTESNKATFATELVWISQQLRAQYGASFAITSPPGANAISTDLYLMQQLFNNGLLTYVTPQYYDWFGYKAVGYISGLSGGQNRNQDWVSVLGPTKVCVGLSANYDYNNSLTLDEANREWDAVVAVYPTERGVSAWNTKLDADGGNAFVNNFKAKFGATGGSGATITNNDSTQVVISGTVGEVNAALNGLVYTPSASYNGPDTITMSTTDGTNTDLDTISVTVGSTSGSVIIPGASGTVFTQPTGSISIVTHGAVEGSGNDITAAWIAAVAAAQATAEKTVWIPPGEWHFAGGQPDPADGVLRADGVKIIGAGFTQSVIYADDVSQAAIWLEGDGPSIEQLTLTNDPTTRQDAWEECKVVLRGAQNFTVKNCWIENSPAASIQMAPSFPSQAPYAAHGYIGYNTIKHSNSDSIHCTDSASDILIEFNDIDGDGVGDDGIACVTYSDAPDGYVSFVTAHDNSIKNIGYGRGMSCVGAEDIYYYNNIIENVNGAAGLYIAQEDSYPTQANHRIKCELNTIKNCGNNSIGHSAVMVYSDGTAGMNNPNDDIWLLRNDIIQNDSRNGIRYFGPQTNVKFDQNRFTGIGEYEIDDGGSTVTVNTPYSTGPVGYTESTTDTAPPPPPPPPSGATGADILLGIFGNGNGGTWLDPQPIGNFTEFAAPGSPALTAYGNGSQGTGLFGRWKDRSGRNHDLTEPDQYSRPSAFNDGDNGPHAMIYNHALIAGAGGNTGAFYWCVVVQSDTYYGTILCDVAAANTGIRLRHDADNAGSGTGDVYVSVGNGSSRVAARIHSGAPNFTPLQGVHVIEAWWEGPGHNLTLRMDKATSGPKLATAVITDCAQGTPDLTLGSNSVEGGPGDYFIGDYWQVITVKNECPGASERDLIATWAAARAGLVM